MNKPHDSDIYIYQNTILFGKVVLYVSIFIEQLKYTLGKKGCYTRGWCVFFVIISISSVREV